MGRGAWGEQEGERLTSAGKSFDPGKSVFNSKKFGVPGFCAEVGFGHLVLLAKPKMPEETRWAVIEKEDVAGKAWGERSTALCSV